MRGFVALLALMVAVQAEDYVDEVVCLAGEMTLTMNNDSSLAMAGWRADNNVYIKKQGVLLGVDGCAAGISKGDDLTFTLNFTACDVHVIQPAGGSAYVNIPLVAAIGLQKWSPQYTFEVSCTYTSDVTAEGGFTVTEASGGGKGGDHGGDSGSTVVGLNAYWIHPDTGAKIGTDTINVGTKLTFVVEYKPDAGQGIYNQILPTVCYIADRKDVSDPDADKIAFVVGSCPASYSAWISDTIAPLKFTQEISAIEFPSTDLIYAHCELHLCVDLKNAECQADRSDDCWGPSSSKFLSMGELTSFIGGSSSHGAVYANVEIRKQGDSGGTKEGGTSSTTVVAAALGTIAGVLVIGLVVLLVVFTGRRNQVGAADPAWANNWWTFYKIPRAKADRPVTTVY